MSGTLRLVLGDQLDHDLQSLQDLDPATDRVLLAEVADEATYVRHHPKKIAFLFSAMRHFAAELAAKGVPVDYVQLDDPANTGSFTGEVKRALERHGLGRIVVTEPGEWRVRQMLDGWAEAFGVAVEVRADDRFVCSLADFERWADGRKQLRMEWFYRAMRKRTGLLLTAAGEPEGGHWNYDADNRKPPKAGLDSPGPLRFAPDAVTAEVLDLVRRRFADHFGDLEPFWFAVTKEQALAALDHFIAHALPRFGDYQDAMVDGEDWLFHSALSQYLNSGLLRPLEVCQAAEAAYRCGHAPLNAVEGFIRQIIGWREYVRGVYWRFMPDYGQRNHLNAQRPLPPFYWTGATAMNCLAKVVDQTKREAHSHHIQRLMVTGNFALLAGIEPKAVCDWYLAVYADAYEWVELPNTLGMALYGDGGVMGSKPYAASGAYIDRMSNFCSSCRFDVKKKQGPDACPFNYLYWNFMLENHDTLRNNPRMQPILRTLDKMSDEKRTAARDDSRRFLAKLEKETRDAA
ncbi:MAG: cryptochrome/photolyase family protein [Geminicoccaceae bacterium]|nr:MAG: cryptochrome/photolyase family protein [Geminicoccaceae bacterium]